MKTAVILETEQYQALIQDLQEVKRKQALQDMVLRHLGYVPLREAMKMTGIKSTQGIHAAAERGDLERRYKSEKKPEFSLPSIMTYLEKKGFTPEAIVLQVAS